MENSFYFGPHNLEQKYNPMKEAFLLSPAILAYGKEGYGKYFYSISMQKKEEKHTKTKQPQYFQPTTYALKTNLVELT